MFTEAPTLLPQAIYLFPKQFDMLPLPLVNVLSLVTLMPSPLTGQIEHIPNLMGSVKTFSPHQRENFFISLSPNQNASRWGTGRQCWTLCSLDFPTQSQQSNYWHHWEIVITHCYTSHLDFMIHTSPHVRELNCATMSE